MNDSTETALRFIAGLLTTLAASLIIISLVASGLAIETGKYALLGHAISCSLNGVTCAIFAHLAWSRSV